MGDAIREDDAKLIVYNAACRALSKARTTDEVRKIRNEAVMLRAYAKQAKNRQLEIDAAEIRIRAERRVGELIGEQRQSVGLRTGRHSKGGGSSGSKRVPLLDAPPTLADAGIDKHLAQRARELAAVPAPKFETLVEGWRERVEHEGDRITSDLMRVPMKMAVHHSSETPEHYTPQDFLAAVKDVFGDIPDLDPCSNSRQSPNVAAHAHYTREDDGLSQPWSGKVFLNPPYGRDIGVWISKVRDEWRRQSVTEIIALLPARTDTEWFDVLTRECDDAVICFLNGRLTFIGNDDPAPFPSMVVYFGPHHDLFTRVFIDRGSLWCRPGCPLEWFVDHT